MVLIAALLLSSAPSHLISGAGHSMTRAGKPVVVESWEKRLAPGVLFRMDWDPGTPRTVFAVRLSLKSALYRPIAELAGKTVYEDNATKGRATVSQMVHDDQALVGINGDFFPFTGAPLNLMVRDGELLSAPFISKATPNARRATFGWGPAFSGVGFATMTSSLETTSGAFKLEGWDAEAEPDQFTLNTPAAGLVRAKAPNVYAVIRTGSTKWGPNSSVQGEVTEVGTDVILRPVPADSAIVVASGSVRDRLLALREGQTVTIRTHTEGFDWAKVTNVVGGGPVLVRDGQVLVDWAEERFRDDFAKSRHPRTAIGRTAKDEIWLVAVDGRSKVSAGATLEELGTIMKGLGCVDAMNLDGGGSTTMNVLGLTMNQPSDGVERPDANGVLILGPTPSPSTEELALPTFNHPLTAKDRLTLRVSYSNDAKRSVRNAEVFWSATGSAWIDQGGTLHLRSSGPVEVTAWVHGQVLKAKYESTGPAPDKPNGFSAAD